MKTMENAKKTLLASSITAIVLSLSACGGGGSDSGSTNTVQMSGAVVDDYIGNGIVYQDLNGNKKRDYFEPFAYTDPDGYFSKAKDGTDYCALPETNAKYQFCLKVDASTSAPIRLVPGSGRDNLTTQAFNSSFGSIFDANAKSLVLSPLSTIRNTMNAYATSADGFDLSTIYAGWTGQQTAINNYLKFLANTSDLSGVNPLDIAASTTADTTKARVFKFSVQFQKIAEAIGNKFLKRYVVTAYQNDATINWYVHNIVYQAMLAYLPFANSVSSTAVTHDVFAQVGTGSGQFNLSNVVNNLNTVFSTTTNAKYNTASPFNSTDLANMISDMTALNNYLNCSLQSTSDIDFGGAGTLDTTYGGTTCPITSATGVVDSNTARNKLFSAELASKAVTAGKTGSGLSVALQGSVKVAEKTTPQVSDTQTSKALDFTTASETINTNTSSTAADPTKATTETFADVLGTMSSNHLAFKTSSGDRLSMYFTGASSSAVTTTSTSGNVIVCQQSNGETTADRFSGTWQTVDGKSYLLKFNYGGFSAYVKRLGATGTGSTSNPLCVTSSVTNPNTCLAVSYPNFGSDASTNPVVSQVFSNASTLTQLETSHSDLIKSGANAPATSDLCKTELATDLP